MASYHKTSIIDAITYIWALIKILPNRLSLWARIILAPQSLRGLRRRLAPRAGHISAAQLTGETLVFRRHRLASEAKTVLTRKTFLSRQPPPVWGRPRRWQWGPKLPRWSRQCYLLRLRRVWCTSQGRVFTDQGRAVLEAWHRRDYLFKHHLRNYLWGLEPPAQTAVDAKPIIHEKLAVLSQSNDSIYGHFLCEVLPRLGLLPASELADHKVYVSTIHPQYLDMLRLLGVKPDQVVSSTHIPAVFCHQAVIPSFRMDGVCEYPHHCMETLERLKSAALAEATPQDRPRRLFLRRWINGSRVNEEAVFEILDGLGFQAVDPARLSFVDQVAAFHAAEVIVGAHGSAFFNMVFSRPGTKIVSLLPAANNSTVYCLARAHGMDFRVVKAPAGDLTSWSGKQQYSVDPRDVLKALEALT